MRKDKLEYIIEQIDEFRSFHIKVRARFPYLSEDVDGSKSIPIPAFYRNEGIDLVLHFGHEIDRSIRDENNAIGHFVNQNIIIRLFAILNYYEFVSDDISLEKDSPGFAEVEILRRLRNIYAHSLAANKSLKPTVTRVTPFAEKAKPAPRYGGLVPPFYNRKNFKSLNMRVILLLFFFSSIVGCTKIQTTPRNQKDLIFDNWVVVYYEDLKLETVTTKDDVDSRGGLDVKIKFMDDSTFCGANTTNSVAGHYTISDGSFMINVYGGTKVGQPEWGNMFSDVVHSHTFSSYSVCDTELRLYYHNDKKCIVLHPLSEDIDCRFTYDSD
jgi:hypothetical protein